jgi:hypothetical protein
MIDPAFDPAQPSMLRDILACRPWKVIRELPGSGTMPARFEVSGSHNDGRTAACLQRLLPRGYAMASLPLER